MTAKYLMCKPLFFNTAWIHPGMETHRFLQYSGVIFLTQTLLMASFRWDSELGLRAAPFAST